MKLVTYKYLKEGKSPYFYVKIFLLITKLKFIGNAIWVI